VVKFGKLDIAVLNAGISQPGGPMSIVETPIENWDAVMKVNTRGREYRNARHEEAVH
jgi:NAD(P)-dependent dehydrogenase (short-subunit alcohol dehydrogenase family)